MEAKMWPLRPGNVAGGWCFLGGRAAEDVSGWHGVTYQRLGSRMCRLSTFRGKTLPGKMGPVAPALVPPRGRASAPLARAPC